MTLTTDDYDDVLVTVAHPFGDLEVPLTEWIATGPGPRRLVAIVSARRRSSGAPVAMDEIPLEYHNSPESRRQQRAGTLAAPWGMPPDEG